MSTYADTSVLVSYLTPDANSHSAERLLISLQSPPLVTEWTGFEFENALHLRRFRGEAGLDDIRQWLLDYYRELESGLFEFAPLSYLAVVDHARRLSARYTAETGARSADIFHVAAAISLKAECFVTLDHRQAAFAKLAGLNVIDQLTR